MKKMQFFLLLFSLASLSPCFAYSADTLAVPLGGNAWGNYEGKSATSDEGVATPTHPGGHLSKTGIVDWTDPATSFTIWFRTSLAGSLHLGLLFPPSVGTCSLAITVDGIMQKVQVGPGPDATAGTWTLKDTGYHSILLKGLSKTGPDFPAISSLVLSGPATFGPTTFVPNDKGDFFYWGRRGPSVHLNYQLPDNVQPEWFYNELTVAVGQDLQGSYFMADGFQQGYFGMQVNSPTSRHILFSVWSPFETDDPKAIPDSQKVLLVKKGADVHTGSFGNEGAGGQSYLDYPWKAGTTYRFLLKALPAAHNYTTFTAWFFAPEDNRWRLIASWNRPATQTRLTQLHSFLENFDPAYGNRQRSVELGRQWVGDPAGRWFPLTRARFTVDNTAKKRYRLDYAGGTRGHRFYLRNGGFFTDNTAPDQWFQRDQPSGEKPPAIDFAHLP